MESKRWLKMAGLLSETVDPHEGVLNESKEDAGVLVEKRVRQIVRKQIQKILRAQKMLSEGLVDMIKKGDDMRSVFDPSTEGWSPTKQMQWGLSLMNYLDPNSDVDGKFGPKTKKALERFQKQNNLKPDGVWGPKTNAAFTAAAKSAIAAGMDANLGTVTDPSPDAPLGTVNATKQWLESLLQYSDLDGKVLRMGRSAKKAQPAPKAPEAPASDITVVDAEMPEELDSWLDSLAANGASHVADHIRSLGAEAREAGDPVPYDPDPSSMQFLPGIEPSLFQNAIVTNAGGPWNEIEVPRRDWEALGEPDLEKLASAMGLDRINLFKKMF